MKLRFNVSAGRATPEEFAGMPYEDQLMAGLTDDSGIAEFEVDVPDKYGRLIVEGSKMFFVVKEGIDKIAKELRDARD